MPMKEYPKTVKLRDDTSIIFDIKRSEDMEQARRFFSRLTPEDRLHLRRDVTRQEVLEERARELADGRAFRLAALVGHEMVAEASIYRSLYGWSSHVGEVRVVVAHDYQGIGLGRYITKEIFLNALCLNYSILEGYIVEKDTAIIKIFEKLGFTNAGVLLNHAIDLNNEKHNLVIMKFDVDRMWRDLTDYYHSFEIYKT